MPSDWPLRSSGPTAALSAGKPTRIIRVATRLMEILMDEKAQMQRAADIAERLADEAMLRALIGEVFAHPDFATFKKRMRKFGELSFKHVDAVGNLEEQSNFETGAAIRGMAEAHITKLLDAIRHPEDPRSLRRDT